MKDDNKPLADAEIAEIADGLHIARLASSSPQVIERAGKYLQIIKSLKEARASLEEHEHSFNLRWNADMRAIKRWQEAHPGKETTWPDHADMVVWLLEQDATLRRERDEMREALVPFGEYGVGFNSDWPDACPLTTDPDAVVGKRPNIGDLRRAAALSGISNSSEPDRKEDKP